LREEDLRTSEGLDDVIYRCRKEVEMRKPRISIEAER
jgi:hypothetical protein